MQDRMHPSSSHARRYSDEVKREAVQRVANGETRIKVAEDVGCHVQVLYRWIVEADGTLPNKSATKRSCPHCANLVAACKLVLVSLDGSRELRNSIARIVAEAVAAYDRTATAPAPAKAATHDAESEGAL